MMKKQKLCPACRKDFLKTYQGKLFKEKYFGNRKLKPYPYPKEFYHSNEGVFCVRHTLESRQSTRRKYEARSSALSKIGYFSYKEYLKSDLWASIRSNVFALFGDECHFCGNKATQVHHNSYHVEVLKGNNLFQLYQVCSDCHYSGEFRNKQKVSPKTATKIMRQTACDNGHTKSIRKRENFRKELKLEMDKQKSLKLKKDE